MYITIIKRDFNSSRKLHILICVFSVSVVKDFEGDKEALGSAEWKDRVEKWKVRQEKRGLVNKDDGNDDDQGLEDDFL